MAPMFRGSMVQTGALLILFMILASSVGGSFKLLSAGSLGYSSGFQGPKARFYGVNYHGTKYTQNIAPTVGPPSTGTTTGTTPGTTPGTTTGTTTPPPSGTTGTQPQPTKPIPGVTIPGHYYFSVASLGQYDTTLRFDPDEYDSGMPNLIGEMTTVFVPEESLAGMASWVPNTWLQHNSLIHNPQATYQWNISDPSTNSTHVYKMEQWVMKFYMSFSAEWDGKEMPAISPVEFGVVKENYFTDLQAWVQLDLTPTWYIQGGGTAYFAVGKIQLSEPVITGAHDPNGNPADPEHGRDLLSVSPESQGAMVYAYYGPFGQGAESNTANTFQGQELNPDLFRDKIYFNVAFNHFGVFDWNDRGTVNYRGDVATFAFDITTFVIGQWDVKDIQKLPEDFGRTPMDFTPANPTDFLFDPRFQALAGLGTIAVIGLVILIVAPEVVMGAALIFGGIGGRRKQ